MLCEVNAQYNLGTYKNGISRRVSTERVAREYLVVPKIADDELSRASMVHRASIVSETLSRQRVAERIRNARHIISWGG